MKPIASQVVVITGASSGIGLATAYAAAARGAKVALIARDGPALRRAAEEITSRGGAALPIEADVSERAQVQDAADRTVAAFGGFDTWVNNAGVGVFAKLTELSEADHRRVFEVNYWGLVHGSLIAVEHLRGKDGALVNVGSILSDVSFPLQGSYCASKAAVRGFTDALRMELDHERAGVSVSLIKPAAIATPFAQHARNYMKREPSLPPPVYAPEDVADAILFAAERGGRDHYVGGAGKAISMTGKNAPGAVDWAASRFGPGLSKGVRPPLGSTEGNLYAPGANGEVRGRTAYPIFRARASAAKGVAAAAGAALTVAGIASALLKRASARD